MAVSARVKRPQPLRAGAPITVHIGGERHEGEFVRYVDTRSGREADVRLGDDRSVVRVPEFALSAATSRRRSVKVSTVAAALTAAFTVVGSVAAVLGIVLDNQQSGSASQAPKPPPGSAERGAGTTEAIGGYAPSDRPTFQWDRRADYVTFNSITDNPTYGDERPFLDALAPEALDARDVLPVLAGQTITFRVFYSNGARVGQDYTAEDVRVKVLFPFRPSTRTAVAAQISAANSRPRHVSDTVTLVGDQPFVMRPVPGSARLWNNAVRGRWLDDALTDRGVLIGYRDLDGEIPNLSHTSAGWVTVKARVYMTDS